MCHHVQHLQAALPSTTLLTGADARVEGNLRAVLKSEICETKPIRTYSIDWNSLSGECGENLGIHLNRLRNRPCRFLSPAGCLSIHHFPLERVARSDAIVQAPRRRSCPRAAAGGCSQRGQSPKSGSTAWLETRPSCSW